MRRFKLNVEKALNGLLMFLERYPGANRTQIMKFFFFADFTFYSKNERPIFGGTYVHMKNGPVPQEIFAHSLPNFVNAGFVECREVDMGYIGYRYYDKRNPEWEKFDKEELKTIVETTDFIKGLKTAKGVSDFSHQLALWNYTLNNEVIPYEFASMEEEDIRRHLEEKRTLSMLLERAHFEKTNDRYWEEENIEPAVSYQESALRMLADPD